MNHNQRRMQEYNAKKYSAAPPVEALADVWDPAWGPQRGKDQKKSTGKQTIWSQNWQNAKKGNANALVRPTTDKKISDPTEVTKGITKAKKVSLQDEPLWQEGPYAGTHPVVQFYSQNLDFSTFPLLCERVYADLEAENPRLRREMPFCAFQHVMTSVLNATIIGHVRTVNAEERYTDEESPLNLIPDDLVIPDPIAEYLKMITSTVTLTGDLIKANFPAAGIPAPHVDPDEHIVEQIAGGFGVCTEGNHNAYECYVSPLVTSRYIEATVKQNNAHHYGPWQPLPDNMTPLHGVPTANLLGYRANVERLNPEGLQTLLDVQFPDGYDMQSRLRWSPELTARVSGTMRSLEGKYKMHVGKPLHGTNTSMLGWLQVDVPGAGVAAINADRLAAISAPVHCSVALGASQCYQVGTFGFRRQRTQTGRGFCYVTAANDALPGWLATINSNFDMVAPFSPRIGQDMPGLRLAQHIAPTPSGDRSLAITSWLRRNYIVKK